jgi:hypothetical protein
MPGYPFRKGIGDKAQKSQGRTRKMGAKVMDSKVESMREIKRSIFRMTGGC